MPDLGIGFNAAPLRALLAKAVADAAAAKTAADTAKTTADTASTQAAAVQNKIQRVVVLTPNLTLAASTAEVNVTWPVPYPDANYGVIPTVWVNGLTVGKIAASPKAGSLTTTGCIIMVASLGVAISAGQTVDVLAIHP